jgi:response regulator RpfG family c-di-GMP phosphodiesterase
MITGVINKPLDAKEFSYTVKSLTTVPHVSPAFVPLSFQTLLNLPKVGVDIFISLSDTNFVKVSKKEDRFTKEDADRLQEKGFKEVFIKASSCFELLQSITLNLEEINPNLPQEEKSMVAMNSIENLENISKFFGWTPEMISNAKKTVSAAIKILSKNDSILKTLNSKLAEKKSHYSQHVGLISFLSCILGDHFEWVGETGKTKLILAALLHDYTLDPKIYQMIKQDFEKTDVDNKAPEIIKYRMHPIESAKIVNSLDAFSSDVEQIVLQHHERPDGTGFPRQLTASRISHLSTLFILLEDLVEFLGDGHYIEMSLEGFSTNGKEKYTQGNFKKFFEVIDEILLKKLEKV